MTSLTFESHVKEGCVEKEWSCGECEGVFVTKDLLKVGFHKSLLFLFMLRNDLLSVGAFCFTPLFVISL